MLLRSDGPAVIAIPQPSHAWLSGEIARALSYNSEPATNVEIHLSTGVRTAGWTSFHDHLLLQLPD